MVYIKTDDHDTQLEIQEMKFLLALSTHFAIQGYDYSNLEFLTTSPLTGLKGIDLRKTVTKFIELGIIHPVTISTKNKYDIGLQHDSTKYLLDFQIHYSILELSYPTFSPEDILAEMFEPKTEFHKLFSPHGYMQLMGYKPQEQATEYESRSRFHMSSEKASDLLIDFATEPLGKKVYLWPATNLDLLPHFG